jgi:uncharacterized protein YecT (DUF1311 family)
MRLAFLILSGTLGLSISSFGQQSPPSSTKTFTPQQRALQQQESEYEAKRNNLRAKAKQVFDAEMAREKTGDCPNAQTTVDFDTCYDNAIKATDSNLKEYEDTIRELLGLHVPGSGAETPAPQQLTPEQDALEFDHLEQAWHTYLKIAISTALHQFDGGTGGPSFVMETQLRLTRNHMRELDKIYGIELHL